MRDKRQEPSLPHAEPRITIRYNVLPLDVPWLAASSVNIDLGAYLEPRTATLSKRPLT